MKPSDCLYFFCLSSFVDKTYSAPFFLKLRKYRLSPVDIQSLYYMNRSFRRRKAVWNLTLTIKPHIAFPSVHRVGTPICGISAQFLPGTGTGCSTAAHCLWIVFARLCVNALSGLYLISTVPPRIMLCTLVCFNALMGLSCYEQRITGAEESISFNALTGLSCYDWYKRRWLSKSCFNALMGLSCYLSVHTLKWWSCVSMPSWAWVVTCGFPRSWKL